MTDIKKTQTGKGRPKAKKLQLNKETLKDLSAKHGGPRGGRGEVVPTDYCCGGAPTVGPPRGLAGDDTATQC
jgi:hypothetical protein